MWTKFRSAGRSVLTVGLASMLTLAAASALHAQSPTPEGTVITNTATVSFTDANGNTYSSVNASVSVTVGFVAGVDVAGAASATPASPSSNNTLNFTIQNIGNGTDHVQVAEAISVGSVITVTSYLFNATSYGTLAALNAALAAAPVAITQGSTITVQVKYDVAANKGGVATNYTLTGTSVRDNLVSDNQVTTITPAQTYAVAVTPDGGQNLQKLPSNGTNYTFTFTVTNNGNGSDNFNLVASNTGSAITVVSVNGVAGTSTAVAIAAATATNIDVVYSVGNVAAGTTDNLKLQATSVGDNTKTDDGTADLTVIRPAITVGKAAYRDDQVTLLGPTDKVLPNEAIQYKVSVTNSGTTAAASVAVADNLPAELTFLSSTGDLAGWTIGNVGNNVTASLTGTLSTGATRYIWIRARVK